jgi:hypothetical protein
MKNIKTVKLFYALLIFAVALSCESELELEPRQSIPVSSVLETESGLISFLVGTYAEAGSGDTFGGETQMTSDLLGNNDQVSWNGTFVGPREFFTKQVLVDNAFVGSIWRNHYQVINAANLVIDNQAVIADAGLRSQTEGEAKFLRAVSYFDLVKLWAQQYDANGNNTQLGVPLRTVGKADFTAEDSQIERASVEAVYALIINDLTAAYDQLPSSNGIFADRYAAQALLARVYLQQGNYAAARDAANDVLQNSGHSLASNFAGAFNNDTDGTEDIFTLQVTSQDGTNALITYYASQANGGRGFDIAIEQGYLDLFDDPSNDERASFSYTQSGFLLTSKYTNQFANVSLLRIGEMHLIRAESNFRLNTAVGLDPLAELNALRLRSSASALSAPLTLDLILNERQLELAFEGHLLFDFKRTDRAIGTLDPNAENLVMPIPQAETNVNTTITQNPGYGG